MQIGKKGIEKKFVKMVLEKQILKRHTFKKTPCRVFLVDKGFRKFYIEIVQVMTYNLWTLKLSYINCRNPSFGLATKAKGITRVRAKEEARELSKEEARESRRKEARESHHILPGVQESVRECEKVLESVRE